MGKLDDLKAASAASASAKNVAPSGSLADKVLNPTPEEKAAVVAEQLQQNNQKVNAEQAVKTEEAQHAQNQDFVVNKAVDPVDQFVDDRSIELPKEGETIYVLMNNLDHMTLHLGSETVESNEQRQFRLNDAQNGELLKLLKSGRPDIAQNIKRLDFAEAEAIARQHMAMAQASRGASSSADKHRLAEALAQDKPRNLDVVELEITHGGDSSLDDADQVSSRNLP